MKKKKTNEIFSMSFLDVMACGFGALVLILLISNFQESPIPTDNDNSSDDYFDALDTINNLQKKIKAQDVQLISESKKVSELISKNNQTNEVLKGKLQEIKTLNLLSKSSKANLADSVRELMNVPVQKDASGIRIDSEYLIFIVDTSGSMVDYGPWNNITNEINYVIDAFPKLKGFIVMSDFGKVMYGDSPWVADTPANRKKASTVLNNRFNLPISRSDPFPALEKAISYYGKNYSNVGIFVFGDDIINSKRVDTLVNAINKLNTKSDGTKLTTINAIAFLTSKRGGVNFLEGNQRFLILMRELTHANGGSLVVSKT